MRTITGVRPENRCFAPAQHGGLVFIIVGIGRLSGGFGAEYERAHHARGAPSTVDHAQVVLGNLTLPGPSHHLTNSLDDVSESSGPAHGLSGGKLSAIGVYGKLALVGCVHGIIKGANLALFAESSIFEADGREDGVSIVELGKLYVSRPVTRHLVGLAS